LDSVYYLFSLNEYIDKYRDTATMVEDVADYKWSSYRHNALGEIDKLINEHPLYTELGDNTQQRYLAYQALFDELDISQQQMQITKATLNGEVYGSNAFHSTIGELIDRVTRLGSHGGDRKSAEYKKQAKLA